MKKLEDKILDKVYSYEKKRTTVQILYSVCFTVVIVILSVQLILWILEALTEQGTLPLVELFMDDTETLKDNIGYLINIVYEDTPKHLVFFLILAIITLIIIGVMAGRKLPKIRRKIRKIRSYKS
jgi:heme/copper-type cytochrome/quinol oxidase subunit 4